ncbi:MAG: hypothetical protein MI922_15805, partial [Bacteroidales bacterium]|nr:hypothetical protein [Bacteroidales bacterium]
MKVGKLIVCVLICIQFSACDSENSNASMVEVGINEAGNYRLFVNGEEFYVKGAGLEQGNIELLALNGGNSFRTWRTDDSNYSTQDLLDAAFE